MLNDINESPGHVFCLQEATRSLCQDLQGGWDTPQDELVRYTNENRRRTATGSPAQHWLVVRGCEEGSSTAVAVRDAYFKGIRRECFVLQDAGLDENKQKFNRLMFSTIKCRGPYFDTNDFCADDEIGIAVAHLHFGCAKKQTHEEERLTLTSSID